MQRLQAGVGVDEKIRHKEVGQVRQIGELEGGKEGGPEDDCQVIWGRLRQVILIISLAAGEFSCSQFWETVRRDGVALQIVGVP